MPQSSLTIGTLASRTSTTVPTIRYYEEIGLLPHAQRATSGHRNYREDDLIRLTFIKRCRDLGFSIERVRDLVKLFEDGDRSCNEVRDMAQVQLDAVREKMEQMRQLEASLVAFVNNCSEASCGDGTTRNCTIIENWSAVDSDVSQGAAVSCCQASARKKRLEQVKFQESEPT